MDAGIPTTEETGPQSDDSIPGDRARTRRKPAGRKPKPCIDAAVAAIGAAGVVRKAFPGLSGRFAAIADPRRQDMCRYSGSHMWWSGTMMFLTRAQSRNAYDLTRNSGEAPKNMGEFCGQRAEDPRFEGQALITCTDNLAHHLRRVPAAEVESISAELCGELLRRRVFDNARVLDCWYVLVFDGTVEELCRKGFEEGGKSGGRAGAPYRYVLQCGLLGPGNTFFPLMHEHCDMHDPKTEKEDCELKAFVRLVARLKKRFPRLGFCITGDSLFCTEGLADICVLNGWKYVLTLKEGRQPTLWEELLTLLPLNPQNVLRVHTGQDAQIALRDFRWVEHLPLGRHSVTAILLGEMTVGESTLYAYVTNFMVTRDRILQIIPATGRERHRIEDYFNAAKNHGIGLGHVFCAQSNGSKNFYSLMQIAGILWTIICHSFLMRVYEWAARATETSLARAIAEGMRSHRFPPLLPEPGQLRFIT